MNARQTRRPTTADIRTPQTVGDLTVAWGLSGDTVRMILRAWEIEGRAWVHDKVDGRPRWVSVPTLRRLADDPGLLTDNYRDIAKRHGCAVSTVYEARAGRGRVSTSQAILAYLRENDSAHDLEEIIDAVKASRPTVLRALWRHVDSGLVQRLNGDTPLWVIA